MKKPDFNFKKPELKLPSFSRKSSAKSASAVKAPQFLTDLYVDLRDRRLLPLVALLLVAIAAVPFLFGGKGEEEPASPAPGPLSTQGAEAEAASFSVVPAEPGLRDYRERLGHRDARDPFDQPQVSTGGGEGAPEGGGGSAVSEPEGSSVEAPSSGGGSSGTTSEEGSGTTTTTTTTDVVVEAAISGYALRARAGFLGDIKEEGRITTMTTLPSTKNPVLVFLGPSKDEKGAVFLMTSNVSAYYGKAKCVLDEQTCSTVELRPGKSATFAYGFGDARYKFTLQKMYPVVESREAASTVTEKTRDEGKGDDAK